MISELTKGFIKSKGWHLRPTYNAEALEDYKTFIPYFCMDASYQVFSKYIYPRPAHFKEKQLKGKLSAAYRAYFASFRSYLTEDQQIQLLDITDEFEEFIAQPTLITKVQYMNAVAHLMPFEKQKESAEYWAVNMLAAAAQGWYKVIAPRTRSGEERLDPNIGAACTASRDLSDCVYNDKALLISEDKAEKLSEAITALVHIIERWAKKKTAAGIQEQNAEADLSAALQELQNKYNENSLSGRNAAK